MTEELTLELFQPHEGSAFRLQLDDGESLELELLEVFRLELEDSNRDPAVRQAPFRLTFRGGSTDSYVPQGMFTLTHDALEDQTIFLVPIGPDSDGMRYEAIFN